MNFPRARSVTVGTRWLRGFTLVELLAVVLIILVLAGVSLLTMRYVSMRMKVAQTQALIAKLEDGIENFKLDNGFYPTTTVYRISQLRTYERTNCWMLYDQLAGGNRKYVKFGPGELQATDRLTNIVDAWKNPIYYYRPTGNVAYTVFTNNNIKAYTSNLNYAVGGLVNVSTYDLFSCGADQMTHVPGAVPTWWSNQTYSIDDIGNCGGK